MRISITSLGISVLSLAVPWTGCSSNSGNSGKENTAFIEATKPMVDSTKVIPLTDLYLAKRFEDLQSAMAAGPDQVYKISFHGRKMGTLSPEIDRFKYLATLDVAGNDLTVLPEQLSDLHYLQGFYAHGNRLNAFPGQILLLPLLERVNLSENQIPAIPAAIVSMDQLTSLSMEKNNITSIPVQLYELENLKFLNLAGNGLAVVPEGISKLSALKKLDLSHNQLQGIPREIAHMGAHLTELMVHGNQIPGEEMEWFIEAMPYTKIRF